MNFKALFGYIYTYVGLYMRFNNILIKLISKFIPGEPKKRPAFERLLLPEYISNDILQYSIK